MKLAYAVLLFFLSLEYALAQNTPTTGPTNPTVPSVAPAPPPTSSQGTVGQGQTTNSTVPRDPKTDPKDEKTPDTKKPLDQGNQ